MINKVDALSSRLDKLYRLYEEKCWANNEDEIIVLLSDNCIVFYYNRGKDNIDEFCLSFAKVERNIYKYLALNLFNAVLGDVYIYKDDNCFYNVVHKPYVKFIVNDSSLLAMINDVVFNQEEVFVNENISNMYKRKPFKIYSSKFLHEVDERIEFSDKRLRSCDK